MYEIREAGQSDKGFGAFSSKFINAGEVVLRESPVLVYPQASLVREICSHCLKDLQDKPDVIACNTCSNAWFCNINCRDDSLLDSGSHSWVVCRIMSHVCISGASDETVSALHLLSRVYGLLLSASQGSDNHLSKYRVDSLQSLSEGNVGVVLQDKEYVAWLNDVYQRFLPVFEIQDLDFGTLQNLHALSAEYVRSVSLKDLVNAYGIRAPLRMGADCSLIRGSAIYKEASRINHECLPNLARCDDFDSTNTCMVFKALHELPPGEELTQSYFPLGWDFENRQTRCSSVYGFVCSCPRCVLESEGKLVNQNKDNVEESYVGLFLLKYLCIDDECEGTMVPVLGCPEKTLVCNVCSRERNETQFLGMLEN